MVVLSVSATSLGASFQIFSSHRRHLGRLGVAVFEGQRGILVNLPTVPFDLFPDAVWIR
jgi:hypothetical protein